MGPEVVVRAEAETGEGPVWDYRTGELVWVDIPAGILHRSDVSSGRDTAMNIGMMLGAVALAGATSWAAAVEDGFGIIDSSGHLDLIDQVIPDPGLRMNDAACDSHGRMWAGSFVKAVEKGQGRLHRWEHGQPSLVVVDGLTLPNGIAWSLDDTEMYFVDSKQGAVFGYEFDLDAGHVGARRVLAEIPAGLGDPDGLCVDADDCLWLAVWGGSQLRRYDPRGRLLQTVEFPVAQPSCCAFGPDTTLYVTSAWEGLAAGDRQPLAGSVFALDVRVRGAPVGVFRS